MDLRYSARTQSRWSPLARFGAPTLSRAPRRRRGADGRVGPTHFLDTSRDTRDRHIPQATRIIHHDILGYVSDSKLNDIAHSPFPRNHPAARARARCSQSQTHDAFNRCPAVPGNSWASHNRSTRYSLHYTTSQTKISSPAYHLRALPPPPRTPEITCTTTLAG